jgi:hypothetical protein
MALGLAAIGAVVSASPIPGSLLDRTANCSYSLGFLDDHPGVQFEGLWQDTYLSWWTRLGFQDNRSPFYSCGDVGKTRACNQEWYWLGDRAWFEFEVQVDGESVAVRFPARGRAAPLFRPLSTSLHTVAWRVLRVDGATESTVAESAYSFFPTCTFTAGAIWGGNFESGDLRWWTE